jgi:hypothetical protein
MRTHDHQPGHDDRLQRRQPSTEHPRFAPGAVRGPEGVLGLQRTVGNQAVVRMLQRGVIQRLSVADYRDAIGTRTGNFSIGSATKTQANKIGADWIEKPATGKFNVSDDGLHQYRKPSYKPSWGEEQANVEARTKSSGAWTTNAHISIIKPEEK